MKRIEKLIQEQVWNEGEVAPGWCFEKGYRQALQDAAQRARADAEQITSAPAEPGHWDLPVQALKMTADNIIALADQEEG